MAYDSLGINTLFSNLISISYFSFYFSLGDFDPEFPSNLSKSSCLPQMTNLMHLCSIYHIVFICFTVSKMFQDLHKLKQYLPLLENLVFHVDLVSSNQQIARSTSELRIRWSSALSSSSFFNLMGPKFYQIDNLRFELSMVLVLYGAILRERALEVLPSGWDYCLTSLLQFYECIAYCASNYLRDTVDLVQSATLFREAAGVFLYLSKEVLPSLQPALSAERPPEATSSMSTVMSLICLAEAQVGVLGASWSSYCGMFVTES